MNLNSNQYSNNNSDGDFEMMSYYLIVILCTFWQVDTTTYQVNVVNELTA